MMDIQRGLHPGGEPATEPAPELQVPPDHRLCQLPGESGRPFCVRTVGQATCPTCPDVSPSPTRTGGGVGWDWATIQRVAEFLGRPDSPGYRRAADQLRNLMAEVGALRAEQDAHEGELGDRRAQLSAAEAEVDRLREQTPQTVFGLPDEPDVPELWDRKGRRWQRKQWPVNPGGSEAEAGTSWMWELNGRGLRLRFHPLLAQVGPLSTTPPTGTETDR